MAKNDPIDIRNQALEAIFADRLRELPRESFRRSLKEKLMQAASIDTSRSHVREGFHSITPYLISAGASNLIEFMKQSFEAEEMFRMPEPSGSIMHAEVRIGDSVIELSDGNTQYPPSPMALHLYVPDADATYARAIQAGGKSLFEPADREYGDRESGIQDPSGNYWYIATHGQRPGEHRPEGLHDVTIYLHPKGAAGMIQYMTEGLGATELARYPGPSGAIMHAKVRLGDSIVELGEAHDQWQPMPASVHFYVPDADAVYARALAAGGASIMPVKDQPYGERSGGVKDPFGNRWWIATYTGKTSQP